MQRPIHSPRDSAFCGGLYSGGSFCYEAQLILREEIGLVRSSTPLSPDGALDDPWTSREHTVIDLGDDVFTRGRPHPMIDHRLRNERIMTEAADPEVAVILFDAVLGYGAHVDPAGIMAPVLREARGDGRGSRTGACLRWQRLRHRTGPPGTRRAGSRTA